MLISKATVIVPSYSACRIKGTVSQDLFMYLNLVLNKHPLGILVMVTNVFHV